MAPEERRKQGELSILSITANKLPGTQGGRQHSYCSVVDLFRHFKGARRLLKRSLLPSPPLPSHPCFQVNRLESSTTSRCRLHLHLHFRWIWYLNLDALLLEVCRWVLVDMYRFWDRCENCVANPSRDPPLVSESTVVHNYLAASCRFCGRCKLEAICNISFQLEYAIS